MRPASFLSYSYGLGHTNQFWSLLRTSLRTVGCVDIILSVFPVSTISGSSGEVCDPSDPPVVVCKEGVVDSSLPVFEVAVSRGVEADVVESTDVVDNEGD